MRAPTHRRRRLRSWPLLVGSTGLLLAAAAVHSGPDPGAPEPIEAPAGAVVVSGSSRPSEIAVDRFLELAGGDPARIVTLSLESRGGDGEPPDAPWPAGSSPQVDLGTVGEGGVADLVERLRTASGIWLGPGSPERWADRLSSLGLGSSVRAVVQRGGVAGAAGGAGRCLTQVMLADDGSAQRGIGLIPGAIVDTWPDDAVRGRRLRTALSTHANHVGLGVAPGSTLVVHGRRLEALGGAGVSTLIAPSPTLPWREERIVPGGRSDLLSLSRAAFARHAKPFPATEPRRSNVPRGSLVLAGGGELTDELLSRFVELSGGPQARIVFIPCSDAVAMAGEPEMVARLRAAGGGPVTWVHAGRRDRAQHDAAILDPLRDAGGVWLGDGPPWLLIDAYQDTLAHQLIRGVLERGGAVGGSGNGASVQAGYLLRGDPLGALHVLSEGYGRGLGLLSGAALDTRFTRLGRQTDMVLLKNTYPQLTGIGLDEGVALVVRGTSAEVIGDDPGGRAFFYVGSSPGAPPVEVAPDGRFDLASGVASRDSSGD